MDLEHDFTVPVGIDTAWAEFQDISSVAECFPGAQVTGVEGETFHGTVKVKLGPISLVYNGSGTFTEKDEAGHRFVVDAKGKDKRGNGTAGATVTLTMTGNGDSTDVRVHTDLSVTGKPAQFGRGVMQDVSDKLLGQFVACLERRLGEGGDGGEAPATDAAASEPAAAGTPATPPPSDAPLEASPDAPSERRSDAGRPPVPDAAARPGAARGSDDALDLARTVLPVVAKSYWKQGVALAVVVGVIIWLIRR